MSFANGSYRATLSNNAAPNFPKGIIGADGGGSTTDTDRLLVITATGTYKNASSTIEAVANIPSILPPGGITNLGPGGRLRLEDQAEVNGNNFDPPALPCSGAACGGTANGSVPAKPGILSDTAFSLELSGTPQVLGTPPTQIDATQTSTNWQSIATSLIPLATITYTSSADISAPVTWGTPSNPAITYITGGTVKIRDSGGTLTGAGILIIDGSSGRLEIEGTANFQGLIIVQGDARLRIRPKDPQTANILGGIVMVASTPDPGSGPEDNPRVRIQKLSTIRSSQAALQAASRLLVTSLLSWREVK